MAQNEMVILSGFGVSAAIDPMGAQMRSLSIDGEDVLWGGDPAVWRDSSPWLFPVIGQLREGYFLDEGKKYELPMHGFAKRTRFDAEVVSPTEAVFTLRDSPETLAVYPWRFTLSIRYALKVGGVDITCRVDNLSDRTMYFSLGAHPGLLARDGDRLLFPGAKTPEYRRLTRETHLMQKEKSPLRLDDEALTLECGLFLEDAMIFDHPDFDRVILRRADGREITVSFDRVPYLGIWSRATPPLRYVCVEPWLGVDDPVDSDYIIAHKEAIQSLSAAQSASFCVSISK